MANVLEKIIIDKRTEVEQRKKTLPLSEFIAQLSPTTKSFYAALAEQSCGFILECKKASPSKGLIRETFDLTEIIAAYAPHAACISVLTDEKYFQGKFDYLKTVTDQVSQPVINKDFFIDEYQVHLARYYGADAILLMLSVLTDAEYRQLAMVAEQYAMAVLTEVSNEQEMQRAIGLKANIIGINNRNLRDLSTDLATTERLAPMLDDVDFDTLIISESGIYTHQDVKRLAPLCDGFLVGSALMAEANLGDAVKRLLYPSVKVCGITTVEQAQWIANSPAQYTGLIFVPASPRSISLADAQVITDAVPHHYVGVFVDAPVKDVASFAESLCLAAVQLHGQEDDQYIQALRAELPASCEIWKAIGVQDSLPDWLLDASLPQYQQCDKWLLDCQVGEQSGGTGKAFDWQLLHGINDKTKLILAGGISPQNAQAAVATGVSCIDVNSGIEVAPGNKSAAQLNDLFEALRAY